MVSTPTDKALTLLLVVSAFVTEGPTPTQCPGAQFPQSNGNPGCLFCEIQLVCLSAGLIQYLLASQMCLQSLAPSSDADAGCLAATLS
jgi:hypothetical protein